ncbi:hypothetical protein [Roseibium sp. SCP14]|uniref:hypothetical protein n=1 Tax=Roseibium sp. SCP14 TaxID=3141375 RepID=UPI00333A1CBD
MIPTFIRSYLASAAVAQFRIVTFSDAANVNEVAQATANTEPLLGTSDKMGAELGGMADVIRGGLGSVELGGPVNAGDPLTSDAEGKAVACAAAAGETRHYVGFADEPGVAGDVIDYFHAPGIIPQG